MCPSRIFTAWTKIKIELRFKMYHVLIRLLELIGIKLENHVIVTVVVVIVICELILDLSLF